MAISLEPELERSDAKILLFEIAAWLAANRSKRPNRENFTAFVKRWFRRNEAANWEEEMARRILRDRYGESA